MYVHPDQGTGRWDNPSLYRCLYVAEQPEAAVGETFASFPRWQLALIAFPQVPGAERRLVTYHYDEEAHPALDLDDARVLLDRALRPTDVVARVPPRTQDLARRIHDEGRWSGIRWWSIHRPEWRLRALWDHVSLEVADVADLPGNPAVAAAARTLAKLVDDDLW